MDIPKIIEELRRERDQIDDAILNLERLARRHGPRRGGPRKWMTQVQVKRRDRPRSRNDKPKEDTEG